MKTKVFFDVFKGHNLFTVWEVDTDDQKIGQYPLLSFGVKKAIVLHHHLVELDSYIKSFEQKDDKSK